jgi:hypothetical protein
MGCRSIEEVINRAYQTFSEKTDRVEYLVGYEGRARVLYEETLLRAQTRLASDLAPQPCGIEEIYDEC